MDGNNRSPQILNLNMQTWNSGTQWGETQTRFCATTETEVGGKLVRLKTFRNWQLKQAVVLASALGEERKIA